MKEVNAVSMLCVDLSVLLTPASGLFPSICAYYSRDVGDRLLSRPLAKSSKGVCNRHGDLSNLQKTVSSTAASEDTYDRIVNAVHVKPRAFLRTLR